MGRARLEVRHVEGDTDLRTEVVVSFVEDIPDFHGMQITIPYLS